MGTDDGQSVDTPCRTLASQREQEVKLSTVQDTLQCFKLDSAHSFHVLLDSFSPCLALPRSRPWVFHLSQLVLAQTELIILVSSQFAPLNIDTHFGTELSLEGSIAWADQLMWTLATKLVQINCNTSSFYFICISNHHSNVYLATYPGLTCHYIHASIRSCQSSLNVYLLRIRSDS